MSRLSDSGYPLRSRGVEEAQRRPRQTAQEETPKSHFERRTTVRYRDYIRCLGDFAMCLGSQFQ